LGLGLGGFVRKRLLVRVRVCPGKAIGRVRARARVRPRKAMGRVRARAKVRVPSEKGYG